jgi:tetratricopeptide (TPR) repeat protein
MAIASMTHPTDYLNLFHRRVQLNIQYWHNFVTEQGDDVGALDREHERVITAITFALKLPATWSIAYNLINSFTRHMERRGYWEAWNQVLHQAVEAAEREGDLPALANLSALLARLLRRQSRFKESVLAYRRAIRLSRHLGDSFGEARACTNLGYYFVEQGYWHRAEVLCCYALDIFKRIGSDHGQAHTENHLGVLYTRQRRWEEAQSRLEQACAIWEKMGDDYGSMYGFMNLGLLYIEKHKLQEALHYSKRALDRAKLVGEQLAVGTINMNIGISYRLSQQLDEAEKHLQLASSVFHRFSNSIGLAQVQANLGLIYINQKNWPKANFYLTNSLNAWHQLGNKFGEIQVMLYLAEYELARKNQNSTLLWLNKLEQAVTQEERSTQYDFFRTQIKEYRQRLLNENWQN